MTHTINQQVAADLLGVTRQRVSQLVKAGKLTRQAGDDVLLSEVMQRKLNPPGNGVPGKRLYLWLPDNPEALAWYKANPKLAEDILVQHYKECHQ